MKGKEKRGKEKLNICRNETKKYIENWCDLEGKYYNGKKKIEMLAKVIGKHQNYERNSEKQCAD